jgi:hypothetical protein
MLDALEINLAGVRCLTPFRTNGAVLHVVRAGHPEQGIMLPLVVSLHREHQGMVEPGQLITVQPSAGSEVEIQVAISSGPGVDETTTHLLDPAR